jgi:hypothetical protein
MPSYLERHAEDRVVLVKEFAEQILEGVHGANKL